MVSTKRMLMFLAMIVLIAHPAASLMAATITVDDDGPADYSTISDALDAASPGDIILVQAGTYHEDVEMKEQVVVKGEGPDNTVLQGVVVFDRVQGARFEGFTVDYGIIVSFNCAPTIVGNRIINGGGIEMAFSGGLPEWPGHTSPPYDWTQGMGRIIGNTITGNIWGIAITIDTLPPEEIDVRWNWWGTAEEGEVRAMFDPWINYLGERVQYEPWLEEPVEGEGPWPEEEGFHYNNIYGSLPGRLEDFIIFGPAAVEPTSWGYIKQGSM